MTSTIKLRFALALPPVLGVFGCQSRERDGGGSELALLEQSGAVGVAECDDFLTKYDACLKDRVPGTDRGQLAAVMTERRASWQRLAADATARAALPAACRLAAETARHAMQKFSCGF